MFLFFFYFPSFPLSLVSPPSVLPCFFVSRHTRTHTHTHIHTHTHARARKTALSARIDALFLPGVAFDREGRRLGRGLGYYDAWAHRARRASSEAAAAGAAAASAERQQQPSVLAPAGAAAEVEDPSAGPLLVGLAFSQQMMAETTSSEGGVPVEQHDVGLDAVAVAGVGLVATSERGWIALLAL